MAARRHATHRARRRRRFRSRSLRLACRRGCWRVAGRRRNGRGVRRRQPGDAARVRDARRRPVAARFRLPGRRLPLREGGRTRLSLPGQRRAREVDPHSPFALAGFDAYAAFPLNDSQGRPLGVLAALDRVPIAFGDAEHAEVVLKVVAGRLAAELERHQAMEDLRRTAVAVSSARPESVFADLAAALAAILHVDCAHIGHHRADDPGHLTTLALHRDGELLPQPALRAGHVALLDGAGLRIPSHRTRRRAALPGRPGPARQKPGELRRPSAGGTGRHAAGRDRDRFAQAPDARRTRRGGAEDLRRSCRGRGRAPGGPGRVAPLGSELPRHLRSGARLDLRARLGDIRLPGSQPDSRGDPRLHARGPPHHRAHQTDVRRSALRHGACRRAHAAGQTRPLRAVRMAGKAEGRPPAVAGGTPQAGGDRRRAANPGLHPGHHRAQSGRGAAARTRGAVRRSSTRRQRADALEQPARTGRRQPGAQAHLRLRTRRRRRTRL